MIYRPDIKPPMWGPPEAVQYAVRANAEQMGIDHASIVELRPFWEVGGLTSHNVVTDTRDRLLDGAAFTQNSVFFRGGQNRDRIVSEVVSSPQLDSIFCFFKTKARAFNKTYDDWSDWLCLTLDNGGEVVVEIKNTGVPAIYNIGGVVGFTGTKSATIDVREKNVTISFHNSSLLVNGDVVDTTDTWNTGRTITRVTWGNRYSSLAQRCIHADIYVGLILADTPNDAQIAQLHETPYALLMPVSRPFIFDMAGGGGLLAPTLTSPAQFSTQSQPVTLEWQAVPGATKYQVQVAEDNLFTAPVVDQIVTGGTTLGVDGLAANTEHFWRVRAGDDS